jgi:hypothetical protein
VRKITCGGTAGISLAFSLSPGLRVAVVDNEPLARLEAVVQVADYVVGRRCERAVDVRELLSAQGTFWKAAVPPENTAPFTIHSGATRDG